MSIRPPCQDVVTTNEVCAYSIIKNWVCQYNSDLMPIMICIIRKDMARTPLSHRKAGFSNEIDQILSTFSITTLTLGQS